MDNLELDSLRNKIDEIDTSLCQMIKERQSLASKIMNAKKGDFPFDPDREEKLIKRDRERALRFQKNNKDDLKEEISTTLKNFEIKQSREN